jgi:hypothetical protein
MKGRDVMAITRMRIAAGMKTRRFANDCGAPDAGAPQS